MAIESFTEEKVAELLKQRDAKQAEVKDLKKKTPVALWKSDLDNLLEELDVSFACYLKDSLRPCISCFILS